MSPTRLLVAAAIVAAVGIAAFGTAFVAAVKLVLIFVMFGLMAGG